MQQIQRGSYENAEITLYKDGNQAQADGSVTVTIYDADDVATTPTVLSTGTASYSSDSGSYIYSLSSVSNYDRVLKIVWSYTINSVSLSQTTYIEVSTPYATISDIIDFHQYGTRPQDLNYKPLEQIVQAERIAKSIINNYTMLTFGKRSDYQEIYGIGSDVIELTERMTSISQLYQNGELVIDTASSYNIFGFDIELSQTGKVARIVNPTANVRYDNQLDIIRQVYGAFKNGARYTFIGEIGNEYVPQDIKMCALLLVGDLLSQEASWRIKYLNDVKIGEMSFKLGKGGLNGTGNVIVDSTLDQYRNVNIVVI